MATELLTLKNAALPNGNDDLLIGCAYMCTTVAYLLLQPFVCKKTSGANYVWHVNVVESGITQRVSKVVVIVESGPGQLEFTSVVTKGCIETGTTSSLSLLAIVTRMIKWYSECVHPHRYIFHWVFSKGQLCKNGVLQICYKFEILSHVTFNATLSRQYILVYLLALL